MVESFAIRLACLFVLLLAAMWLIPPSVSGEDSLKLCLEGAESQSSTCETNECRVEVCRKAAQEGHAQAMMLMGYAHVYGKGVAQDNVQAYMYFKVINDISDTIDENHRRDAKQFSQRALAELGERMSQEDISRAEAMALEWIDENLSDLSLGTEPK